MMPPAAVAGYRNTLAALLLGCGALLAGCDPSPPAPPAAEPLAEAPGARPPGDPDPAATAAGAVAAFLAIDPARVRVLDVSEEVFADASLGCPEPDMLYAQVLTPGWRVLAEAEGRRFDVRVSGSGARICHRKALPAPGARSEGTAAERAALLARDDLAARTGASADAVRVLGWWPVPAGAEVPGCAIDCPEDAPDCGLLMELELDERRYRYHVVAATARPCAPISPD
jgi:hypothetical protein